MRSSRSPDARSNKFKNPMSQNTKVLMSDGLVLKSCGGYYNNRETFSKPVSTCIAHMKPNDSLSHDCTTPIKEYNRNTEKAKGYFVFTPSFQLPCLFCSTSLIYDQSGSKHGTESNIYIGEIFIFLYGEFATTPEYRSILQPGAYPASVDTP